MNELAHKGNSRYIGFGGSSVITLAHFSPSLRLLHVSFGPKMDLYGEVDLELQAPASTPQGGESVSSVSLGRLKCHTPYLEKDCHCPGWFGAIRSPFDIPSKGESGTWGRM